MSLIARPRIEAQSTIVGVLAVGETLTVIWRGVEVLAQIWTRDGVDISGETGLTYVVTDEDQGATIGCRPVDYNLEAGVLPLVEAGRIEAITTILGGRPAPVPQGFYDAVRVQAADPNTHPHMGPFTHVAVKDGLWSDPTVWDTGTIPDHMAIVNTSTFAVVYDLYSETLIFGIHVGGPGLFRIATDRDIRLRLRTAMAHGVFIVGEYGDLITESPTLGKARVDFAFHEMGTPPGITVELGLNTMNAVRMLSVKKTANLEPQALSIAVDAVSAVVTDLNKANWRVGDKILFVATGYAGTSPTDSWYQGPTSFYNDVNFGAGALQTRTNNDGYMLSQDEVRTITGINTVTNTLTWDEPLDYAHTGETGVLPQGQTVTVRPKIALLSRPIVFRTASPNNAEDLAADPALGALTVLQNRAHIMLMHHDDVDVRGVEIRNMGRTDIDPSMVVPSWSFAAGTKYSHAPGNPSRVAITNPLNVQGRYAFHLHWSGAFFGRRPVVVEDMAIWSPLDEPPTPGIAFAQHASRANVQGLTTYRTRASGIWSELGTEIGQLINCISAWNIGDGFPTELEDRTEHWSGHNGHGGMGQDHQARNILIQDCLSSSSYAAYHWQVQTWDPYDYRVPQDVSIRYRDPLAQGGDALPSTDPIYPNADTYGRAQPQIPPGFRNHAFGCKRHVSVTHRGPMRPDSTPMVWRDSHSINTGQAFRVGEYSNSYYMFDSLWDGNGGGVGASMGSVTWRWVFGNILFRGYGTEIFDAGSLLNYEGEFIDCTRADGDGVVRFNNQQVRGPFANDANTYPWYNVMGDAAPDPADPTNPKKLIPRKWRVKTTAELPTPYPLAPYGLKLPGGYPAVAPGDTPYFVLLSPTTPTFVAGNIRNQMILTGVIRDSVGDRRFGDYQSGETFPDSLAAQTGRSTFRMTGEQAVLRNGCFLDGGVWKTRLSFLDHDRHPRGDFFRFHIDCVLTGFTTDFLLANQMDPATTVYETSFPPEKIGAPRPYVRPTAAPLITSATAVNVPENQPLLHRLKANDGHAVFSIVGGVDAAQFELSGGQDLRWVGNGTKDFEAPVDTSAAGLNTYQVTVRVADPLGNTRDVAHVFAVTDVNEVVYPYFSDSLYRSPSAYLDVSSDWERVGGVINAVLVGVGGGPGAASLPVALTGRTLYLSPTLASTGQSVQAINFGGFQGSFFALSVTDADNWIGFREHANACQVWKCVGGTLTSIGNGPTRAQSDLRVNRLELIGSSLYLWDGDALVATFAKPSDVPLTNRQGIVATGAVGNFARQFRAMVAGRPATIIDGFTAADGTDISTRLGDSGDSWILPALSVAQNPILIHNNRAFASVAPATRVSTATAAAGSPDYQVTAQFTRLTLVAGDTAGIIGRASLNVNDNYYQFRHNGSAWQLYKTVNNTATPLGADYVDAFPAGEIRVATLKMVGTTISGIVDGVERVSIVDAAHGRIGRAGLRIGTAKTATTGTHVDNFSVAPAS